MPFGTPKQQIQFIVELYIRECPEEFEQVKRAVAMKKHMTRDEYASIEGSEHMRGLYEMSEEMQKRLIQGLDEEALVWLKTLEGGRWFARQFPVFALPNRI